jgi:hypothetical protein
VPGLQLRVRTAIVVQTHGIVESGPPEAFVFRDAESGLQLDCPNCKARLERTYRFRNLRHLLTLIVLVTVTLVFLASVVTEIPGSV